MDPTVDDFGEYKLQLTSGGISGGAAALQWGPDGLLYVVGRQGFVYAIEVERTTQLIDDPENPGNQIEVTDEYLGTIKWSAKVDTPNFNDIGGTEQLTGNNAGNPVGSNRQALGVAVTTDETTGETVVYVSHSDITIGAGTSGTDKGLDTNSGVITRYTLSVDGQKDVTENEAIDIVRGLPRSEENHASNGMAFTTGPNGEPLLLLAQGGHANAGATSNNFSGLAEYAYSASILSIDLNQIASIEAERKAGDPNADYVYDLPTLDDPTRGNYKDANGDDILIDTNFDGVGDTVAEYTGTITQAENDDFVANNLLDTNNDGVVDTILGDEDDNPTGVRGGNDGLNQAKLTVGSPVQVYAYGYRNPYDVLVTEDGKKLSYDNGANGGWGGPPLTESGAPDPDGVYTGPGDGPLVTNAPNPNQGTGSQGTANFDNLHFFEQGDHAGHAHPLQARGADAGWWTSPGSGTNGAEQLTDTPLGAGSPTPGLTLPADWDEIVDPSLLNPEAGDYREGGITDGAVDTGKGSWNGLAEYTGTAFGEEFKGAILATQTGGTVKWIKRNEQGGIDVNPGGGAAVAADQGVVGNTGGGNTLGIDAVGDLGVDGQFGGAFNNTIWVGHLGQDQGSNITIFEANGVPTPPSDNNDGDAFNNTVDVFDYSTTQGVNTLLDDNDTPSTADDVFNLLSAGQSISYENSAESYADTAPGGIGVVGMMINGEDKAFVDSIGLDGVTPTGEDGLRSFSANVVPGGAGSGLQIKDYFSGTAKGTANDQIDAFTYAASFDQSVGAFQITGVMAISESGFARDGSEAGVQMGVGNQSNYLSMVLAVSGSGSGQTASIDVYYEEDDAEVASQSFDITAAFDDFNFDGADLIEFRFFADAIRGTVTPQFRTYAVSETPPAFTSLDTVDLTGDVLDAVRGQYVANGATSALAFGNIGTSDLELGEAPALGNVTYDRFQVDAFAPIVDAFVEISDVAADEDAGTASITLSLVDAQGALVTLGDSVEVDLSVGGSASSGSDYTVSIPSTETFASGENQKTYVFSIVDDAVSESTETVDVEITEIRGSNGLVVIPTNGETVGTVTISDDDQPVVAYRINAGGPTLTATDDGPDWASGSNTATLPDGVTLNTANQSVHALQGRYDGPTTASGGTAAPDYVPDALFVTERWDPAADPEMIWTFAVDAGTTYAVRLFMSNGFTGTSSSGERVFDVEIEGSPIFENIDLSGQFGHQTGGMFEYVYQAGDDLLEIEFIHKVENPLINGFEILNLDADAGPDVIAPEVASIEATEPATSADPITVTVVFTDETGLDVDSITAATLTAAVGGAPQLESVSGGDGDVSITAVFTVPAPVGGWPSQQALTFSVDGVTDEAGNAIAEASTELTLTGATVSVTAVADVIEGGDLDTTSVEFTFQNGAASTVIATYSVDIDGALTEGLTATLDPGANVVAVDVANDAIFNGNETVTVSLTGLDVDASVATIDSEAAVAIADVIEDDTGAPGTVLYRVNAGGPTVAATDGGPDWTQDQGQFGAAGNSPFLAANSTGGSTYSGGADSAHAGPIITTDPSLVGLGAPDAVFNTERFDQASDPAQLWQFDVGANAEVEVTLLFAELFGDITAGGQRVFDYTLEGVVPAAFNDIDPFAAAGAKGAFAVTATTTVGADGVLDLEGVHITENPAIKGIQIAAAAPSVTVTAEDVSASEDVAEITLSFTLSAPVLDGPITVPVSIVDQTTTSADYTPLAVAEVTFEGGSQAETLVLSLNDDDLSEGDETFAIVLGAPTDAPAGLTVNTVDGVGTILDDDGPAAAPAASLAITSGLDAGASTFGDNSFVFTNDGDVAVSAFTLSIADGLIQGAVFDPAGTAGDATAKDFTPGSTGNPNGAVAVLSDAKGNGGFTTLTVTFATPLEAGAALNFGLDIDPISIEGGANDAGSVSGLELSGGTLTVSYEGGATQTADLFAEGSAGGALAVANATSGAPAPGVTLKDIPTAADPDHPGNLVANIPDLTTTLSATVEITGTPGDTVRLFLAEVGGTAAAPPAAALTEFEGNTILAAPTAYVDVLIPGGGVAEQVVTLPAPVGGATPGGLYYLQAAAIDTATGAATSLVSPTLVIKEGDLPEPPTATLRDATLTVAEGADLTVTVDLDGAPLSYPVTVPLTFTPGSAGAADVTEPVSFEVVIASGLEGSVTLPIVDDALVEGVETFTVSLDPSATDVTPGAGDLTVTITDGDFVSGHDEAVDGDLGSTPDAPTVLQLAEGSNHVKFTLSGGNADRDFFTVVVPDGATLDEIVVVDHSGIPVEPAFGAFVIGSEFDLGFINLLPDLGTSPGSLDPADQGLLASFLAGGYVYGDLDIGENILDNMAADTVSGFSGFTEPLGPGEYTFWFNQGGGETNSLLDFVVTDAPGDDPADIDGDGVLNIDDPFAYDGDNGAGRVLTAGGDFTQDFNTDTTDPFSPEGGFTGILVNPEFDYPGSSETDPYGPRTFEEKVDISGGTLNVTSSNFDAFPTSGTDANNTLADGYQSAVDVTGVRSFEVHARISSVDWVSSTTSSGGFEQFGISLGAGGVDDFVKLVLSDNNTNATLPQRLQLAHNNSLTVGEQNYTIALATDQVSPTIDIDLSLVGDYELRLIVDRDAGANGTVTGKVDFFAAADGALLGSFTTPAINIAANSSLIAAMDGVNPLTGGDGHLAYGIFVSDWSGGSNEITANYDFLTIRALDTLPDEAPTVALANVVAELLEDADTTAALKIADIVVTDDGVSPVELSLIGEGADLFEIVDGVGGPELLLKAGVALDHETIPAIEVTVVAEDAVGQAQAPLSLPIGDVNEAPTLEGQIADQSAVNGAALSIDLSALTLADEDEGDEPFLVATQEGGAPLPTGVTLSEIDGVLTLEVAPDATPGDYQIALSASDGALASAPVIFALSISEPGDIAPTVALENALTELPEDADTTAPLKVADIVVTDDDLSPVALTLAGVDAGLFDIVDVEGALELQLKADTALDHETADTLDVSVVATDAAGVGQADLSLPVVDVNEAPSLSGTLGDQTAVLGALSEIILDPLTATDPDEGDVASVVITGPEGGPLPEGFAVVDGVLTVAATAPLGEYALEAFAEDAAGLTSAPQSFTVTVQPSPTDIDGDGVENTDDPFAFDGDNGAGRVLVAGGDFTQDFNTDTADPFSPEGGFTGILVNPAFDYPNASETDPYGARTFEDKVDISGGTLNVESSGFDAFPTSGTDGNNTLADGYQSAVDVSGVRSFEVHARISSADWLESASDTNGFEQFGITLGAGGVDDFVKLVVSDQNGDPQRVQLAHNNSLVGGENNFNIVPGSQLGTQVDIDLSLVGDYEFRLIVDRDAGENGTVTGKVDFFAAADGALLGSFTTPPINIAANSSLIDAMDGANPLTGGVGHLAYGIFVSDFGAGGSNVITANYDFLTIRALDEPVDAPPTVALENAVTELPEDTDTTAPVKIADIAVTDDELSPVELSLIGEGAELFEIVEVDGAPVLQLKAGALLDHETAAAIDVTVVAEDAVGQAQAPLALAIGDVNEAPTLGGQIADQTVEAGVALEISLDGLTAADVDEGDTPVLLASQPGGAPLPDGVSLVDDELGARIVVADDADPGAFTIEVTASDGDLASAPVIFTLTVTAPVDVAPTVALENVLAALPEDADTTAPIKVADIVVTDDSLSEVSVTLAGDDADLFDVVEVESALELQLKADAALDHETADTLDVTVVATDAAGAGQASLALPIEDVNEAPTLGGQIADQTTDLGVGLEISLDGLTAADEDEGDIPVLIASQPGGAPLPDGVGLVEDEQGVRLLVADEVAAGVYTIEVTASDGELASAPVSFTLTVAAPVDVPPVVTLEIVNAELGEDADTVAPIKIADITVTDDSLSAVVLSLSGADADLFEIVDGVGGPELLLKSGVLLDFESAPQLDVSVVATDDAGAGSADLTVVINDVNEAPTISGAASVGEIVTGEGGSVDLSGFAVADPDAGDQATLVITGESGGPLPAGFVEENGALTIDASVPAGDYVIEAFARDLTGNTSPVQSFTVSVLAEVIPNAYSFEVEDFDSASASFYTENQTAASGGEVLRLFPGTDGVASMDLAAAGVEAGVYDISLFLFDESDGESTVTVEVGDKTELVTLDQDGGGNAAQPANRREIELKNVSLDEAASITITADADGGEFVRLDLLTLDEVLTPPDPDNQPPFVSPFAPNTLTVLEGETVTYDLNAWFSDPDEDALTFEVSGADFAVVDNEADTLTLSPDADDLNAGQPTIITLSVTADDGSAAVAQSIEVTVEQLNDAPTLVEPLDDVVFDIGESDPLDIDVAAAFDDADLPFGDVLAFTAQGLPEGVDLVVDVDAGTARLVGSPLNPGSSQVTITATDLDGETAEDTFFIDAVGEGQSGPTVRIQAENLVLDGFEFEPQNAADGDPKGVAKIIYPPNGDGQGTATLNIADVAELGAGQYRLTLTLFDEDDGESTVTALVDGAPVGVAVLDQDGGENAAQAVNLRTVDFGVVTLAEQSVITFAGVGDPGEFVRLDYLELAPVADGGNFRPVVVPGFDETQEFDSADFSINLLLAFTDDQEDLTFSLGEGAPDFLSIDGNNLVAEDGVTGVYDVVLIATDGGGLSAERPLQLTLDVPAEPTPPVLTAPLADLAAPEDAPFSFTVPDGTFTEADGDQVDIIFSGLDGAALPSWLNDDGAGLLSGAPTQADVDAGPVEILVTATDKDGSATDSFTITPTNVNDAPVADATATLDTTFAVTVGLPTLALPDGLFTDEDPNDVLTLSAALQDEAGAPAPLPDWLVFDPTTGTFTVAADAAPEGDNTVVVTATDIAGETATFSFALTATAEPKNPGALDGDFDNDGIVNAADDDIDEDGVLNVDDRAAYNANDVAVDLATVGALSADFTTAEIGATPFEVFFDGVAQTANGSPELDYATNNGAAITDTAGGPRLTFDTTNPDTNNGTTALTRLVDTGGNGFTFSGVFDNPVFGGTALTNFAQYGLILSLTGAPGAGGAPDGDFFKLVTGNPGNGFELSGKGSVAQEQKIPYPAAVTPTSFAQVELTMIATVVEGVVTLSGTYSLLDAAGAELATGPVGSIVVPTGTALHDALTGVGEPVGFGVTSTDFGANETFEVSVASLDLFAEGAEPDVEGPTASVSIAEIANANSDIVVTAVFSDETGLDAASLDGDEILLVSDGGDVLPAPSFAVLPDGVTATYTYAAPAAGWVGTTFTANLVAGAVSDAATPPNANEAGATVSASVGAPPASAFAPNGDLDLDGVLNAVDPDVDGDTIPNVDDPFSYDAANGRTLAEDEVIALTFDTDGTIYENGLTGFLPGTTNGGAFNEDTGAASVVGGQLVIDPVTGGDTGGNNNPEDDVWLGVKNGTFTLEAVVENPWFDGSVVVDGFDQIGISLGLDSLDMVKMVFGQTAGVMEVQSQTAGVSAKTGPGNGNIPLPDGAGLGDFATAALKLEVTSNDATSATVSASATFFDANGAPIPSATDVNFGSLAITGALAAALADPTVGVGAGVSSGNANAGDGSFVAKFNSLTVSEGVGEVVDPPSDPDDGIEILEGLTDVDTSQSYAPTVKGSARLGIKEGSGNIQISNFGADSFLLENTGDKKISAVLIDTRDALYRNNVIDIDGSAGDIASKKFGVNSGETQTGGFFGPDEDTYFFAGDDPLANTTGTGKASTGGFRGVLVKFDSGEGDGFENGETVGFAGDMDTNSIAGLEKSGTNGVDTGSIPGWDVGGVSGAELIGSRFYVLFNDGATATGHLHGDGSFGGSVGEAVESAPLKTVDLTVNGVGPDQTATYGGEEPLVEIAGAPGDVVRIVLTKGFNPVANNTNGVADLVAARLADAYPEFQANNAFDFQAVDITIGADGTGVVALNDFTFATAATGVSFDGDDTAPIAFAAAVIDPSTGLAVGPVTKVFAESNGVPVVEGTGQGPSDPKVVFLAQNGGVVFEAESADTDGTGWEFETTAEAANENPDPQGEGYIIWEGGNSFGGPPANSILTYNFLTDEGGNYIAKALVGRRNEPDTTEANDLFIRLVDADGNPVNPVPQTQGSNTIFHVRNGEAVELPTSQVDPENPPNGAVINTPDKWMKFYVGGVGLNELKAGGQNGDNGGINVVYALEPNTEYALQIGGRSNDFEVDRLALSNDGAGAANTLAANGAESPTQVIGDTDPEVANPIPDVAVQQGVAISVPLASNVFRDLDGDTLTLSLSPASEAQGFALVNGAVTGPSTLALGDYTVTVIATDDDNGAAADSFVITVQEEVVVEELRFEVQTGADDWEEFGGAGSADLEFGLNGPQTQWVGIRIDGVSLTNPAQITEAYLEFEAIESNSGGANFQISLETSENASPYTAGSTPGDRSYTNSIAWSPEPWQDGVTYQTPNLADLIRQVVGADGVADGALGFYVTGTGSRAAHSFNSDGAAPVLVVKTGSAGGGGNSPPEGDQTDVTFTEGDAVVINLLDAFSDPDLGDTLEFEVTGLPNTLQEVDGVITGTAPVGTYTATVTVSDGEATIQDTFTVTIEEDDTGGGPGETLRFPIVGGNDDWEQLGSGGSADLEFGLNGGSLQYVGVRIGGVTITDPSQITDAYLEFEAFEGNSDPASFQISIEQSEAAATYSSQSNPASRSYAPTSVSWTPEAWQSGQTYRSADLTDLIKGVIGTDGIANGALGFFVEGTGSRAAHSFNSNSGAGPVLVIETGGGGSGGGGGNTPPQGDQMDVFFGADQQIVINLNNAFSDADPGDSLDFEVSGLPNTLQENNGVITGSAPAGTYTATVEVTDGEATIVDTFNVTVAADDPTNTPPMGDQTDVTVQEGDQVQINLNAAFSDDDPGDELDFTVTGLPLGLTEVDGVITGTAAPGTYPLSVQVSDGEAAITDGFTLTIEEDTSGGGGGGQTTQRFEVQIGNDDWEQFGSGSSSDLELGENDGTPQFVGIRFQGVDIDAPGDIVDAYIEFNADGDSGGAASFLIEIEDTENSGPYFGSTNPSTRDYAGSVAWNPEAWTDDGVFRTSNLSEIVQDLVGPDGVQDGALAFQITGSGERAAYSFNATGGDAPVLVIVYEDDEDGFGATDDGLI